MGDYLSRIKRNKKPNNILGLSVNLEEPGKESYDFSFIKPIMLTDFTPASFSVLRLSFMYTAGLFSFDKPAQQPVLSSYFKEYVAKVFGHILVAVPDQWVMVNYTPVPRNIPSTKLYCYIKAMLARLFPYATDQLYFDVTPVPDALVSDLADSNLTESNLTKNGNFIKPDLNTIPPRIYQVLACPRVKIQALENLLKLWNGKLVLIKPRGHAIFTGAQILRKYFADQLVSQEMIDFLGTSLTWSDLQNLKVILGLKRTYDLQWGDKVCSLN